MSTPQPPEDSPGLGGQPPQELSNDEPALASSGPTDVVRPNPQQAPEATQFVTPAPPPSSAPEATQMVQPGQQPPNYGQYTAAPQPESGGFAAAGPQGWSSAAPQQAPPPQQGYGQP